MSLFGRRTFLCQRCGEPVRIDPRRDNSICERCEMASMLPEPEETNCPICGTLFTPSRYVIGIMCNDCENRALQIPPPGEEIPSDMYERVRQQALEQRRRETEEVVWGGPLFSQLLNQMSPAEPEFHWHDGNRQFKKELPTITDNIPPHMFKEYSMLPESVRKKIEQGMINATVAYSDVMAEHKDAIEHKRRAIIEHLAVAIVEANKTTVVRSDEKHGCTEETHRLFTYTQEEWLRILIDTFYAGFDYAKDKMEKKDDTK